MKHQKSCGPRLGKLVHQLPGVVTFAYDLHFRRMIARWKDLSEAYNARDKMASLDAILRHQHTQKKSFRASKWTRKFRTQKKLLKIVNCRKLKNWKKQWWGFKLNRWLATNIHLDHSSPLRKKWSPLHWVPPWDEETSAELGPWWATCPSEGVGLLWQLNIVGSYASGCSWSVCP